MLGNFHCILQNRKFKIIQSCLISKIRPPPRKTRHTRRFEGWWRCTCGTRCWLSGPRCWCRAGLQHMVGYGFPGQMKRNFSAKFQWKATVQIPYDLSRILHIRLLHIRIRFGYQSGRQPEPCKNNCADQGCGSGSTLIWVAGSGSGSRKAKMSHKKIKKERNFMFWNAGCSLLKITQCVNDYARWTR